jgi:superfamily II RNA helicase
MFSELGTLVIDGDALVNFLIGSEYLGDNSLFDMTLLEQKVSLLSQRLTTFIKNFKQRGFDNIKIAFFHSHSRFTVDENDKLTLNQALKETFDNYDFIVFDDWIPHGDTEWTRFNCHNHVCLLITSDCEIYKQSKIQFRFIKNICLDLNKSIQVAIIDNMTFVQHNIFAFLIYGNQSVKLFEDFVKKTNEMSPREPCGRLNDSTQVPQTNPCFISSDSVERIANHILNGQVLELNTYSNNNEVIPFQSTSDTWELKIHYKKAYKAKNPNRDKQKYFSYMERYAESLNASKYLHHKIIMVDHKRNDKSQVAKVEKLSTKESQIIQNNAEKMKLSDETKDMTKFKRIKDSVVNIEQLSRQIQEIPNLANCCQCFLFNLEMLKIKLLKREEQNQEKKSKLFLWIKDLFLVYQELLIMTEAKELTDMLQIMLDLKFYTTAKHLKNITVEKIRMSLEANSESGKENEKLPKKTKDILSRNLNSLATFHILENSFNHDVRFQMNYLGEFLRRTLNSQSDKRVCFKPDKWQKDLLDIVDRRESALICCPTSSGKTFISYYAMEKSLRNSNDDVVVFVSPMKSLVNQVAAEVYARFGGKPYPKQIGAKTSVYAISMPDYVVNDPFNCQILITVPSTFESILSESKEWVKNIKYIVIDEVQVINELDHGASIEKIIHFAQCPILALSATIGNLDDFYGWMKETQLLKGITTNLVVHKERFCDLKKFTFVPSKVECDLSSNLIPVHELFGYSEKNVELNKYSQDFHLLPSEIVELIQTLNDIAESQEQKELVKSIEPENFFKCVLLNKSDIKEYERFLMNKLNEWYTSGLFGTAQIQKIFSTLNHDCDQAFSKINHIYGSNFSSRSWMIENIAELVENLHDKKLLPAIVFLNSGSLCDALAERLVDYLDEREKENSSQTEKDLKKQEKSDKALQKRLKNQQDKNKKNKSKGMTTEEGEDEDTVSQAKRYDDKFTFLDFKHKMGINEIEEEIDLHKHRPIPSKLFDAWKKGIGVHHAFFHTKFRSSVECLFRRRHLQIVFATKTLSLGLNMPCKTVVLPSDSMSFDTIYYRHMVGRAGRRGFDNIGNIVYYGLPANNIKRFISSNISKITGRFSLDMNLILQVAAMHNSKANNCPLEILKSFVESPILKLTSRDFNSEGCKQIVKLQVNYFLNRKLIDENFLLSNKANLILPMRNENVLINLIHDLIDFGCFNDRNCAESEIMIILSHFVNVIYIHKTHAKVSLILPKHEKLMDFLKLEQSRLDKFLRDNEDLDNTFLTENLAHSFPSYYATLNLPKNSYIYDFYMHGNMQEIADINDVDEGKLWYAMKSTRALLTVINNCIKYYNNPHISKSFMNCLKRTTECFEKIEN